MKVSVPSIAPISPPLTGASSMDAPSSFARAARRRAIAGAIVLESTITVPFDIAPKTPSSPSSTFSTSGPSGSIVMMCFAARATSAGDVGRRRAFLGQFVDRAAAAAVDDDGEALLQKIAGHGLAHEAETDESDGVRHGVNDSPTTVCARC